MGGGAWGHRGKRTHLGIANGSHQGFEERRSRKYRGRTSGSCSLHEHFCGRFADLRQQAQVSMRKKLCNRVSEIKRSQMGLSQGSPGI